MEIIDTVKQAIIKNDLKKVDDLWTEMILDGNIVLEDFFEVAKDLKKIGLSEHAFMLLEMLATHFESERQYQEAINVYKNMLYYTKDDLKIRKKLINLYKILHKGNKHLDEYIDISGFNKTEPIFKAIRKFDQFLKYDIGKFFYFERYGTGEVIDTVPSKREIVINFEKKERHFLTIDIAEGLLTPIDENHFLHKKYRDSDELKSLAQSEPLELIKMILKGFSEPLSSSKIKMHLKGVIEKTRIDRFWETVRKKLASDRNIRVSGKTAKIYSYVESGIDRDEEAMHKFRDAKPEEKYLHAEEYAHKMSHVFKQMLPELTSLGNRNYKKTPALALDILLLFKDMNIQDDLLYTIEDIFAQHKPEDIITQLKNANHQLFLLRLIKEKYPDRWIQLVTDIIFTAGDFKLIDATTDNLKEIPGKLDDIYYQIFSMPKKYSVQFQWLLKKIESGCLKEFLKPLLVAKLIEYLDYVKGIKSTVKKILSLESFDEILKETKEEEARRILDSIYRSTGLVDYEKKDFLRIIEHYFPKLFKKEKDIVYTTINALNKKKEKLNHILSVEIPKNRKEISRAREYGDLSENFEYKAAKERQDQLYQRVRTIESELQRVKIIDPAEIETNQVNIGTNVTLKNSQDGNLIQYVILGRWDTDLQKNIISNEAPLAKSLLGKKCGDNVIIDNTNYEIIKIDKAFLI